MDLNTSQRTQLAAGPESHGFALSPPDATAGQSIPFPRERAKSTGSPDGKRITYEYNEARATGNVFVAELGQ